MDEPRRAIIEVRGLTIGWEGAALLENVTFDVLEGEIFAILGGSGSGKTTLMRHLVGLEPAIGGDVVVAGRRNRDLDEGLPPFGVMFQAGALFASSTVGENVALPIEEWTDLPPDAVAAIASSKLRLVGLDGAFDKLPSELSGGMRKRAAIARALALEPRLVFLDEPSSGLDPILSAEIDALIMTLNEALGLTVVVVTHTLESVFRIVHRAILLDKETSSVVGCGTPDELANSPDLRVRGFFDWRPSWRGPTRT